MNIDAIEINPLSIRAKQAIGAILLYEVALIERVLTRDLGKLISHQFSVLSEDSLPKWEQQGAVLPVNGRGDSLDKQSAIVFRGNELILNLIDFSTEIGFSCMYVSDFDGANRFLLKCIEVIQNSFYAKIVIKNDFSDFESIKAPDWGAPISAKNLLKLKKKNIPVIEKL